ncbi:hypothetical protein E0Z10_g2617 [Xylaria hypoxylon]|uniref:Uncharacterized protein n=1 Tax=Xylaria hypoxylon TaxID=37992 RepID=A0A4Z0Z5L6_9PEZI|nr:hypothetical protein E0Z10_g2617 [Xylaria hypoxylon]
MDSPRPPFTTSVLGGSKEQQDAWEVQNVTSHLPASHRTKKDHIIAPQADIYFLGDELLVDRINAVQDWLWWYGELRLGRLNTVYRLRGFVFRGYSKVTGRADYTTLIAENFAILATLLGYVVLVLSSLQVGLSVDRLVENTAFVNFSYGFTVFSILAPVILGAGIFAIVLAMFISNWLVTKKYEEKRFREMGVEPYWRNKPSKVPTASLTKRSTSQPNSRGGV